MKARHFLPLLAILAAPLPAAAQQSYDIHVIESLTGNAAFLGKQENDSLELERPIINAAGGIHGQPVRFIHHDDQSSPQVAVQLVNGLLPLDPALILGPTLVPSCGATEPLILKNGPIMYCFGSGVHPPAGSYGFSGSVDTANQLEVMVRFLRLKGWTRIAFISTTDATGQDGDRSLAKALALPENREVKVVEQPHFNVGDVSVSAQIERIRAANPQMVIVWTLGSATGTVFRGLIQDGLELPVATNAGNMTYNQMQQFAQILPKQCYFSSPSWPVYGDPRVKLDPGVAARQKQFFAAFAAAKAKPDQGSALAWDAAAIFSDALRQLPAGATAKQLHDFILRVEHEPGVGGVYDFVRTPQRGLGPEAAVISLWDASRDRWVAVTQPGGAPLD